MHKAPIETTRHIHENLWIVLSYALARPIAAEVMRSRFRGEFEYLNMSIHENAERRADRALLEMAVQIRVLDDKHKFTQGPSDFALGTLHMRNGSVRELSYREMTNKVIHGSYFEWQIDGPLDPKIIVSSSSDEKWESANIEVYALMATVGQMAFGY